MALSIISQSISFTLAGLYTVAGQAHFTDKFTPEFYQKIEQMTRKSYVAFEVFGLPYNQTKMILGGLDLLAAYYLWQPKKRSIGLSLALIGFGGGLYSQWVVPNGEIGEVSIMFSMAVVGFTCDLFSKRLQ